MAHINALMEQESRNVAAHSALDEHGQQLQLHPHLSSVMGQVQVHPVSACNTLVFLCSALFVPGEADEYSEISVLFHPIIVKN